MINQPHMIIIAGPNGSGKTTTAMHILKNLWACETYMNADKIADGLSPLNPQSMNLQAGKIMLQRIQECLQNKITFSFETTLASLSFLKTLEQARSLGYRSHLFFLWLPSPDISYFRVQKRVQAGRHDIPLNVIQRRFLRGLQNCQLYADQVDSWSLVDNTSLVPRIIAQKTYNHLPSIMDEERWALFQKMISHPTQIKS